MYERIINKLKRFRNSLAEILSKAFILISFVGLVYSLTLFFAMCLLGFYWVKETSVIFLTSVVLILLSKKMGY